MASITSPRSLIGGSMASQRRLAMWAINRLSVRNRKYLRGLSNGHLSVWPFDLVRAEIQVPHLTTAASHHTSVPAANETSQTLCTHRETTSRAKPSFRHTTLQGNRDVPAPPPTHDPLFSPCKVRYGWFAHSRSGADDGCPLRTSTVTIACSAHRVSRSVWPESRPACDLGRRHSARIIRVSIDHWE